MNKKLVIGCVAMIFMLISISYVSAFGNINETGKKESPLFSIRTNRAIDHKIKSIIKNSKFAIRNRIYITPLNVFSRYVDLYDIGPTPAQRSICCTSTAPTCYGKNNCLGYQTTEFQCK